LIAIAKANKLFVECVNLLTPARGYSVAVNNYKKYVGGNFVAVSKY
jgi:hypothetical protein